LSKLSLHGDLDAGDLLALRDLVRFGVMADDQIARRYADPALAKPRLAHLREAGIISLWWEPLEDARVYSPTRLARLIVGRKDLHPHTTYRSHVAHDVALVDLADCLLAADPSLQFFTEDEVRGYLDRLSPRAGRLPGDSRHRPDGLLVSGNTRIAVELEHSDKTYERYTRISHWFVREWRIDHVRWFVDNPKVLNRLRHVNEVHGFDRDMQIEVVPFPPDVRIRQMRGRYEQ